MKKEEAVTAESSNTVTTVKDSTVTEVTYRKRDTTITIPGDTLKVKVPFYQLTPEPQTFQGKNQKAVVSLSTNDELLIDCITQEVDRLFQLTDELKTTLKTLETTKTETIIVPERYVPWYIKILAWLGGIAFVSIAAVIVTKFIKP